MFDHSSRVDQITLNGHIQTYHGETDAMVMQKIKAKLPNMGEGFTIDIHKSGNIVTWKATRLERSL